MALKHIIHYLDLLKSADAGVGHATYLLYLLLCALLEVLLRDLSLHTLILVVPKD